MYHLPIKQPLLKMSLLIMCCLALFSFKAPAGIDRFEVYLNNKLILKDYASKDISLKSLQLDKALASDQLTIYYKHCHFDHPGTSRTISVKDEKGNLLKQWKFADASNSKGGMVIPVSSLLELEKNNADSKLTLIYAAAELPGGQLLAAL